MGDEVRPGSLLAKPEKLGARIFSSTAGRVKELTDSAVVIEESGEQPEDFVKIEPEDEELLSFVRAAGVVGMGGAGFPTDVKLKLDLKNGYVLVNAAECEPYLTSDHALMMTKGDEILVGVSILMRALEVSRAVIGIENNKKDAILRLSQLAMDYPGIEVMPLKVQYPQGGEKQLIDAVLRKQIKSGALPISAGAVVQNVGTVFAVYEAVQKNKPLVERIVTVTGKHLEKPSNYHARIGIPIGHLIEASGGLPEDTGKIIGGGPMMGKALLGTEVPVTKGTSGILILPQEDAVRRPMRNCIRCAKCVSVCPMGLNPAFLMRDVQYADWETTEKNYIVDCIECGSCSYTCPSNRPLLDFIRIGKQKVTAIIRSRKS